MAEILNRELLITKRNEIFQMIIECGLNPSNFSWSESITDENIRVSRLNFFKNDFYFIFLAKYTNGVSQAATITFRIYDVKKICPIISHENTPTNAINVKIALSSS